MNIQSRLPTTPDEFLLWNEGREGKREFVRGRVVEMMINVTRNHWRLANRLTQQLAAQLDGARYDVGAADFGVRTPDGVRYPDMLVDSIGKNGKALAADKPLLVAEILSPSSIADDFGPKARDYLALPSLLHYLILAQDEVRAWLWTQPADGDWAGPSMHADIAAPVVLEHLAVELDLRRLYAGIAGPRQQ